MLEDTADDDPVLEGMGSEARAAEVLASAMQPRLAIVLDLLSRAAQRRPGYATAARKVIGALEVEVGRHLRADAAAAAGTKAFEGALALLVRQVTAAVPPEPVTVRRSASR